MNDFEVCNYPGPAKMWDVTAKQVMAMLLMETGLMTDSDVVDVGAGPLRIGERLIRFLRPGRYHAIEPNAELLETGIARVEQAGLKSKDAAYRTDKNFAIHDFGHPMDLILAFNVFIHCGRTQLGRFLTEAKRSLRDEGVIVCSVLLDDGTYHTKEKSAGYDYKHASDGLAYYGIGTLDIMVREHGLRIDKLLRWARGTPVERESAYQVFIRDA